MSDEKHFVWIKSTKVPEPQIWYGDLTTGQGALKRDLMDVGTLLLFITLKKEEHVLTLDELSIKYPCPKIEK